MKYLFLLFFPFICFADCMLDPNDFQILVDNKNCLLKLAYGSHVFIITELEHDAECPYCLEDEMQHPD